MKWTKAHSRNAVAKRARLRIARALVPPVVELSRRVPAPRPVPDFTINIRSRSGDRVQITATRWGRQLITGEGITSARRLTRGMEMLLRHATP